MPTTRGNRVAATKKLVKANGVKNASASNKTVVNKQADSRLVTQEETDYEQLLRKVNENKAKKNKDALEKVNVTIENKANETATK